MGDTAEMSGQSFSMEILTCSPKNLDRLRTSSRTFLAFIRTESCK